VDAQLGRLMQALEDLDLADRTVIVVWSDHGYHLGEHLGVWQKRCLFEESARAPLLIYAPDSRGNGRKCSRVVELVDLYPTVAELCGIEVPDDLPGKSLVPLLKSPDQAWESVAVTQVLRPGTSSENNQATQVMGRSIRTQRWRYTEWNAGAEGTELYDHDEDPQEFENLAGKAEYQPLMRRLRIDLEKRAQGNPPTTPVNPARL
jgi:iduronate 2-sulfatase